MNMDIMQEVNQRSVTRNISTEEATETDEVGDAGIDAYIFTKEWQRHNKEEMEDSSDDEFESEMNAELDERIDDLYGPANNASTKTNMTESERKALETELANDQLLYDPDEDDEDEKWVNENMRPYAAKKCLSNNKARPKPSANSDAILNCPACLSILCLDCQRHEIYNTQYRAMFVQNCKIDRSEKRTYSEKKAAKRRLNNGKSPGSDPDKEYAVVRCEVCDTEVAVYEENEDIYHFHNVLSSY